MKSKLFRKATLGVCAIASASIWMQLARISFAQVPAPPVRPNPAPPIVPNPAATNRVTHAYGYAAATLAEATILRDSPENELNPPKFYLDIWIAVEERQLFTLRRP
ncbi:MAG: hypothetical protein DMF41_11445 [Verrucomicrobia bacterium]|nr:MAG: hypothetical protein DMF41_11445 [Verrucomicrobiota bacterium]